MNYNFNYKKMYKYFLYSVVIFLSIIFPSNQLSADYEIPNDKLYAMKEQYIIITFDTEEISLSKINPIIKRDSITQITGSCYDVKDNKKQANCTFDLSTVTPDKIYDLLIYYDTKNNKIIEDPLSIEFGFVCVSMKNYFDNKESQNSIIICNKEVATTSSVSLKKESKSDIVGDCERYKEDGRKLNCTFQCSDVEGGSVYLLKVIDAEENVGNVNEPEITIGKAGQNFIKMTPTIIIFLILILF